MSVDDNILFGIVLVILVFIVLGSFLPTPTTPNPAHAPLFLELKESEKNPYFDMKYQLWANTTNDTLTVMKDTCHLLNETEDYFIFNCTCLFPESCDS
jgi:hypothetical protein